MSKIKQLVLAARSLLPVSVLLFFATGYTECEYFTDITVPATDTTTPIIYDAVWVGGDYVDGAITGASFQHHLAPGDSVLAISSALDTSGLKKLTMRSGTRWTCCNGSGICSTTQPLSVPATASQAGGVGSLVSNGMWLYASVTVPGCSSGFTLHSFSFGWWTEGEDFHGHRSSGELQSIVYP